MQIHFHGNHGFIDSNGFIVLNEEFEMVNNNVHLAHRIDGKKFIK
jgi:hypothetical protein